jgi:hypothetical protein
MKAVERRETRVYNEDAMNSREILYMITPIMVGSVASVMGLFVFIFIGSEEDILMLFLMIGIPLGLGVAAWLVIAIKLSARAAQFGLKGVSRGLLSATILFLDMLLEGYIESGNIVDPSPPEEYSRYASMQFYAARFALKKLDLENYKMHTQLLKEKRQASWSTREKLFNNYAVFALIPIVGSIIAAIVLQSFNLISEYLAIVVLSLSSLIGVLLVCMIGVYLRKNSGKEPSEEVERAILEPDLKTETHLVLDRLLGILISEGEHPLRVMTIGEYDELNYTDNTYLTSRGIMLREAVLIPRQFSS